MLIVQLVGIKNLDTMEHERRMKTTRTMVSLIKCICDIKSHESAVNHIHKAMRRQRNPKWEPVDNWGGDRYKKHQPTDKVTQVFNSNKAN